jgi:hypothetical protein
MLMYVVVNSLEREPETSACGSRRRVGGGGVNEGCRGVVCMCRELEVGYSG